MSSLAPASTTSPPRASWLARAMGLDLLDNRYPVLHGLRVIAILSVIQYHVTWILGAERGVSIDRWFFDRSISVFFGMDLFFVLSGFLIGSILLRSIEHTGSQGIRRFYLRRIFRTFPSYWLVLAALVLAFGLTPAQRDSLPYEIGYLTNFRPLFRDHIVMFWGWSLALEEQFYLTVPVLFAVLRRIRNDDARILLLVGLWLVPLVARLVTYYGGRPWNDFALYDVLYFRTPTRFDPLVAGILLALLEARYAARITRWLEDPFHRTLLALPMMACVWVLLTPELFGWQHTQLVRVFAWGTVTSVMWLLALLLLLHGDGAIQRVLGAPAWRRLATVGYGVYLVHIPLIDHVFAPIALALQRRGWPQLATWSAAMIGTTVASFALGYVLHVVVEKPAMRLRDRLAA